MIYNFRSLLLFLLSWLWLPLTKDQHMELPLTKNPLMVQLVTVTDMMLRMTTQTLTLVKLNPGKNFAPII